MYLNNSLVGYYPPPKAAGYKLGIVPPAGRSSECPDVSPSVTNLLGLYLKDYYRFEHET